MALLPEFVLLFLVVIIKHMAPVIAVGIQPLSFGFCPSTCETPFAKINIFICLVGFRLFLRLITLRIPALERSIAPSEHASVYACTPLYITVKQLRLGDTYPQVHIPR